MLKQTGSQAEHYLQRTSELIREGNRSQSLILFNAKLQRLCIWYMVLQVMETVVSIMHCLVVNLEDFIWHLIFNQIPWERDELLVFKVKSYIF